MQARETRGGAATRVGCEGGSAQACPAIPRRDELSHFAELVPVLIDCTMDLRESFARKDPISIIAAFADHTRTLLGDAGVFIEIEDHSCGRLVVTRGMNERLAACLGGSLGMGPLAGIHDGPLACPDVASDAAFEGTFLLEGLRQSGFAGIFVQPARVSPGPVRGWACFALREGMVLTAAHQRAISLLCEHMVLALEHIWLLQSSEGSAARLHSILDSAYDAIVILGSDCRIESVNRAVVRQFGFSERELAGRALDVLFADGVRETRNGNGPGNGHGNGHGRGMLDRFPVGATHEVECRKRDGSVVYADLILGEIEGGRGYTAIFRDVTARKSTEARMRDADRLAVIGTLAAGLGHDMNNVLLPVRAHLNAIASLGRMNAAERVSHLDRIRSGISYLQHLADSLHGLALDPDGEGDGLGTTDLSEWWSANGPLLSKSLHRSVSIETSIPAEIGRVSVSPHALTRAVLNLLVNAGEAMPKDRSGHWPKIVVRARATPSAAHLEVSDNGMGMSQDVIRRVFDMFFTTKTRGLGTGLGLPLVRRVVERAGGSVEIDSRPGLGTTVRLVLPYAEDESPAGGPLVSIKMDDGRAAAIITGFLHSHGATVDPSIGMLDADLAIVEAARVVPDDIRRWLDVHRPHRLVVLGRPTDAVQDVIASQGITAIPDMNDIFAIERGLEAALSAPN